MADDLLPEWDGIPLIPGKTRKKQICHACQKPIPLGAVAYRPARECQRLERYQRICDKCVMFY